MRRSQGSCGRRGCLVGERETWYKAVATGWREQVHILSVERDGSMGSPASFGYRRTKAEALEHLRDQMRQEHRRLQNEATRLSRLAALAEEQAMELRMAERLEVADD